VNPRHAHDANHARDHQQAERHARAPREPPTVVMLVWPLDHTMRLER